MSQYLIRHVQYDHARSQSVEELFFRTLMFKISNKIDTWEYLERTVGPLSWASTSLEMEGTDHGKAKRRFRCGDLCRVELGYADAIVPRVAVGIRKGGVTARLRPEEWTNPFFSMSSSAPAAAIRSACSFVDWAISGA